MNDPFVFFSGSRVSCPGAFVAAWLSWRGLRVLPALRSAAVENSKGLIFCRVPRHFSSLVGRALAADLPIFFVCSAAAPLPLAPAGCSWLPVVLAGLPAFRLTPLIQKSLF